MAKKVVSVTLHNKKLKPIKHTNKAAKKLKSAFTNIFNYLKSDSYMFAPLASHTSFPASFSSDEVGVLISEPQKKKEKKLGKDIKNYLKRDCYMYAPILHFGGNAESDGEIAPTMEERRRQDKVKSVNSSNEIDELNDSYNPTKRIVNVKHNILQMETHAKHILHGNRRISSLSGKV